jgi:hypothetical protein
MRVYVYIRFFVAGIEYLTNASFEVKEGDDMDAIASAYVLDKWPGATRIEWLPNPNRGE